MFIDSSTTTNAAPFGDTRSGTQVDKHRLGSFRSLYLRTALEGSGELWAINISPLRGGKPRVCGTEKTQNVLFRQTKLT